ncbi:MAG: hypothetical protein WCI73_07250, partial [Phycisphaerae bacterium]
QLRAGFPNLFQLEECPRSEFQRLQNTVPGLMTPPQRELIARDQAAYFSRAAMWLPGPLALPQAFRPFNRQKYASARRNICALSPWLYLTPDQLDQADKLSDRLQESLRISGYSIPGWQQYYAQFAGGIRKVLTPAQLDRLDFHMRFAALQGLYAGLENQQLTLTEVQKRGIETLAGELTRDPTVLPGDITTVNETLSRRADELLTPEQKLSLLAPTSAYFPLTRGLVWSEDQRRQIKSICQEITTHGTPRALYRATLRSRLVPILTAAQRTQVANDLGNHGYLFMLRFYDAAKLTDDQKHTLEAMCYESCRDLETIYRVPPEMDSDEQSRFDFHSEIVPRMITMTRIILTATQKDSLELSNQRSNVSRLMPILP